MKLKRHEYHERSKVANDYAMGIGHVESRRDHNGQLLKKRTIKNF
jgi:hypothetical protein